MRITLPIQRPRFFLSNQAVRELIPRDKRDYPRLPHYPRTYRTVNLGCPCAILPDFPEEDSQEWLSYNRVRTTWSSSVRTMRGHRRPKTNQSNPAAMTISMSKRSAFASGAASNDGQRI